MSSASSCVFTWHSFIQNFKTFCLFWQRSRSYWIQFQVLYFAFPKSFPEGCRNLLILPYHSFHLSLKIRCTTLTVQRQPTAQHLIATEKNNSSSIPSPETANTYTQKKPPESWFFCTSTEYLVSTHVQILRWDTFHKSSNVSRCPSSERKI